MNKKTVIGTNLAHEKVEMDVSRLSFRVSIYGILIENNKVLLTRQLGGLDLPGGGLDIGETFEEGLEREYWEETGLKVKLESIVDVKMNFFQYEAENQYQSILIYAACSKISGELSMEHMEQWEKDHGGGMPEWISLDELENIKLIHTVDSRPMIRKATML